MKKKGNKKMPTPRHKLIPLFVIILCNSLKECRMVYTRWEITTVTLVRGQVSVGNEQALQNIIAVIIIC